MSTGDSTFDDTNGSNFPVGATNTAESSVGSDSYYQHHSHNDGMSSIGGGGGAFYPDHSNSQDASEIVHEMYLALLYLLSNPDEFKKALHAHPPRGATTLDEWNAELEEEDDEDAESVMTSGTATTPLPFIVFADDAEVVLPQAHTASQLFGIEKVEGIELEAAAGIPALSQLFLRWLALMPGGDHLNIIDPPGLTVMRIAGGRYRVTAAHRVVWTWMNEFASMSFEGATLSEETTPEKSSLQMGDLVTLTIVDVFETDNQGKLLSYCPTFDNKKDKKDNPASETIRKSSQKFFSMMGKAQKAVAKSEVNKRASAQLHKMGLMQHAKNVAENVKHRVGEAVHNMHSPNKTKKGGGSGGNEEGSAMDYKEFKQAISAAEQATATTTAAAAAADPSSSAASVPESDTPTNASLRGDMYVSEVSTDVDEAAAAASTAEI